MKIRTEKELLDGKYIVTIGTESFTAGEDALLDKFGEPLVETGGTFTDGSLTFTVAADPRKLKTGMVAVQQIFDSADTDDAEEQANLWALTIQNRSRAAITELRNNVDGFTGTTVETV